jgi:protein tyrosine/serine phosphatase
MGADYTQREFEKKLQDGLLFMSSHNPPYLIHGIEGRERTGFFVALLEALMGASAEEIKADYMLSYVNMYKISPEEERYAVISYLAEDILQKISGGKDPSHTDLQKDAERYILENIGISQDELEALKQKLAGAHK